ncbi:MAG TPA: hypothetical protein VIT23_01235 [Terrimicrobiaceae bacterium]
MIPSLAMAGITLGILTVPRALQWPKRIVVVLLLSWALRRALQLVDRLSRADAPRMRIIPVRWTEAGRPWFRRLEILLAVSVLVVSAWHMCLVIGSMSQSSLNVDEIGTVGLYSAQGPAKVVTNYGLAKNHIFFNFLNSLLPGADSLNPLRARILSICGVVIAWCAVVWYGVRRDRLLEFALVAALIGLNQFALKLNFQARGYGFLLLFALAGGIALLEYLKSGKYLWLLGWTTVLGVYTVPYYIVFGGPLLLSLFLTTRKAEVFRCGLLVLGSIAILYSPVWTQLLNVTSGYEESYGVRYNSLKDVFNSIRYVIPQAIWEPREWSFFILLAITLVTPVLLRCSFTPESRTVQILLGSTFLFFAFCLMMATPPHRVTAFLASPILLAVGLTIGSYYRHRLLTWSQPILAVLVLGPLCVAGVRMVAGYTFVPDSYWQEAARLILNLAPARSKVWIADKPASLRPYLVGRVKVVQGDIPIGDFEAGRVLLFDKDSSDKVKSLADTTANSRCIVIGGKDDTFCRLWFVQPADSHVSVASLNGRPSNGMLTDLNPQTSEVVAKNTASDLTFDLDNGVAHSQSFNLQTGESWATCKLTVFATSPQGETVAVKRNRLLIEDHTVSINTRGLQVKKISIHIPPTGTELHVTEAWAVPDPGTP